MEADNLTDPDFQITKSTHFMTFWLEDREKHGYRFLSNLSNSASCSQHQKNLMSLLWKIDHLDGQDVKNLTTYI